ncbi:hypothetical protein QQX10_10720 [Demequina sp. SYSU T00039]|uniref:Uncharacterized protein n=1 Tax=Demequina lignilytica TaxID=3051663 RepID=A0AAW7M9G2_9MICO|nr:MULTISPECIES: hypothetical protein [unclassified Demequina]MDN4478662.1 hypothetical protein [Demequina sp. SYSU T00039-1]MDN4488640.1 hypothetical protein [Demequina sp. SYSU T00039]
MSVGDPSLEDSLSGEYGARLAIEVARLLDGGAILTNLHLIEVLGILKTRGPLRGGMSPATYRNWASRHLAGDDVSVLEEAMRLHRSNALGRHRLATVAGYEHQHLRVNEFGLHRDASRIATELGSDHADVIALELDVILRSLREAGLDHEADAVELTRDLVLRLAGEAGEGDRRLVQMYAPLESESIDHATPDLVVGFRNRTRVLRASELERAKNYRSQSRLEREWFPEDWTAELHKSRAGRAALLERVLTAFELADEPEFAADTEDAQRARNLTKGTRHSARDELSRFPSDVNEFLPTEEDESAGWPADERLSLHLRWWAHETAPSARITLLRTGVGENLNEAELEGLTAIASGLQISVLRRLTTDLGGEGPVSAAIASPFGKYAARWGEPKKSEEWSELRRELASLRNPESDEGSGSASLNYELATKVRSLNQRLRRYGATLGDLPPYARLDPRAKEELTRALLKFDQWEHQSR